MTKPKSIRTVAKSAMQKWSEPCGYLYPDGIDLWCRESYKGQKVDVHYGANYELTGFGDNVARIVVHNVSLIMFGKITHIRVHDMKSSTSEFDTAHDLEKRSIEIMYEDGAHLSFYESRSIGERFWHNHDVAIQLIGDDRITAGYRERHTNAIECSP